MCAYQPWLVIRNMNALINNTHTHIRHSHRQSFITILRMLHARTVGIKTKLTQCNSNYCVIITIVVLL